MRAHKALSLLALSSVVAIGSTAQLVHADTPPTPPATPTNAAVEVHISDDRAVQMATQLFGPSIAAHMLHRVETPLTDQPTGLKYGTVSETSSNWSGYVPDTSNTGRVVTSANAYFNVASISGGTSVASWVGVGGYRSGALAQTGVDHQQLKAWYELLPANPVYVLNVRAGDLMSTAVSLDQGNGLWYIYVGDTSTNTYYANEFSYSPDRGTADFIDEVQGGSVPTHRINFSTAFWTYNGSGGQALTSGAASTLHQITESDPSGGSVCPSGIGSGGESFSTSNC